MIVYEKRWELMYVYVYMDFTNYVSLRLRKECIARTWVRARLASHVRKASSWLLRIFIDTQSTMADFYVAPLLHLSTLPLKVFVVNF